MSRSRTAPFRARPASVALVVLVVSGLAACGEGFAPPRIHGPGPSADVATRVAAPGEVTGPSRAACVGPADEVAALGAVCRSIPRPVEHITNAVGDLSFVIGDAEAGPKILVLGYFDPNVTSGDHRADIRYAAYFEADSHPQGDEDWEWYLAATLARWSEATPLPGEIVTDVAGWHCGTSLRALATFTIGNVIVTVHAEVVLGC